MLSLFYMLAIFRHVEIEMISWQGCAKCFFLNDPFVTWFCSRHRSLLPPVTSFMAMFGNGMCYDLWIAPVALYGSIHIMAVRYMWAKFTKSFIMEMAPWQIPVLCDFFFCRVWGRCLCNCHLDCSFVWNW